MTNQICSAFKKNPDGSWTSVGSATFEFQDSKIVINPGMTVRRGVSFSGIDLAQWLDENCSQ